MNSHSTYVDLEREFDRCEREGELAVAFFPVGCTEQHGPYLPIETDTIIASGMCEDLSSRLGPGLWGHVFPPLAYAPTRSNQGYPGTVSIDEDALRHVVRSIADGMLESRFGAVVFVSGHGPADNALCEVCFKVMHGQFAQGGVVKPVVALSLSRQAHLLEGALGLRPGRHADWRELLFLVHLLGEAYFDEERVAALKAFQAAHDFTVRDSLILGVPLERKSVSGVLGDPVPQCEGYWPRLAAVAWETTAEHLRDALERELLSFENGLENSC